MELIRHKWGWFPVPRILSTALKPRLRPQWSQLPYRLTRFSSTLPTVKTGLVPPTGITLRDYQEESIQAVLNYLDRGHRRLGISLATGAGKTVSFEAYTHKQILSENTLADPCTFLLQVIFTQLISRIPPRHGDAGQTLIIVHRRELVEQAARHCRLAYPDRTVEIEMGSSKASGIADITIASIKSLVSKDRIEKFHPNRFKLVLVDEAHHIVAPSYREVLGYFGLSESSEDSPVLVGVSATFSRFDGLKLGAAIDHIVYHKDYVDMIDEKWLTNAVFTTVKSLVGLSRVKNDKFGDFATPSLSQAVNMEKANNITVRTWLTNAADRKSTLVFCVNVEHVKQLTAKFREYGVDARYITAASPKQVRVEQLRAFKNQEYAVLLNCGLFTEGTDIPNIDCVLLAKPTRSRNLLIQMIGRGLRLFPGKKDCHIIDMVGTLQTGVLSTPTLFGLHPDEVNKSTAKDLKRSKELKESSSSDGEMPPVIETIPPEEEEDMILAFTKYDSIFDLIGDIRTERYIRLLSPNAWVRLGENRYLLSDISGWLTIEKEGTNSNNNDNDNPFSVKLVIHPDDTTHTYAHPRIIATAPDLETAVHAADTYAMKEFNPYYIFTRQFWRRSPATESQLNLLNKAKIRDTPIRPGELTRGQAGDMIAKLKFGGKKWYKVLRAKRRVAQMVQAEKEFQELMKRGVVRVGPVEG